MSVLLRGIFYFTIAVILYLATTTVQIKAIEGTWDKANHFLAFFVLYILLSLAYKSLTTQRKVIYLLAFGALIEIVQYFTPGRDFSLMDIFADGVGITIGMAIWWLYTRKIRAIFS